MKDIVCLELGEDYPLVIMFDNNGGLISAEWYDDEGREHRENNLPCLIDYYQNKCVAEQKYAVHGEPYRNNDLPHTIHYHENGAVYWKFWGGANNTYDRVTGPVSIYYNENGQVLGESYYLNNDEVDKDVWLKDPRVVRELKHKASGNLISDVSL